MQVIKRIIQKKQINSNFTNFIFWIIWSLLDYENNNIWLLLLIHHEMRKFSPYEWKCFLWSKGNLTTSLLFNRN
jgi:hypothetical protein